MIWNPWSLWKNFIKKSSLIFSPDKIAGFSVDIIVEKEERR